MIKEGQIILFNFPSSDRSGAKLRPALIIRQIPGVYDDWLICMISSQLAQQVANLDEVIDPGAPDWKRSGLKVPSVIRITRVAVAHESILLGTTGEIDGNRLDRIKQKLSNWLLNR